MDEQFLAELKDILFTIDSRVTSLEHTLNDVIIQSWKEAAEEEAQAEKERVEAEQRKLALEQFTAAYPEVAELADPLKKLYGDEYDVYDDLYSTMQNHVNDEGFDEAAYVNGQLEDVKGRLAALSGNGDLAPEIEKPDEDEEEKEEIIDEAQLAKELAAAE